MRDPHVEEPTSARATHADVLERRLASLSARAQDPDDDLPDEPTEKGPADRQGEGFALPFPGRHASRRAGAEPGAIVRRGAVTVVPQALRGRVRLGAPQLGVVAVVIAVGLAVTAWWVVRSDPQAVPVAPDPVTASGPELVALEPVGSSTSEKAADPAADPGAESGAESGGGAGSRADPADGASGTEVTVDVAGKVRRPGVVVLPAGARVVDAVEAAGGSRRGVDLTSLNLARVLVDGEQVPVGDVVPAAPPAAPPAAVPGAPAAPGPADGAAAPSAPVNLNTADLATLETLPQVGPVTAQSIATWREQHGAFTAVEELLEVDGIGEVTLGQIAPHATV